MIRQIEHSLLRVAKEIDPFLLLLFYHSAPNSQALRLKVLLPGEAKKCYCKDLAYEHLPALIRQNFGSLGEFFEEMRIISRNCFHFEGEAGQLTISLQVGSKLKRCLFELEEAEYTYTESVELLLHQTEKEMQQAEHPEQVYLRELQDLRTTNLRLTKEISSLSTALQKERSERQSMKSQLEASLNDVRTELYEVKMNYEGRHHSDMEEESHHPHSTQRPVDHSSLICEEKPNTISFIVIEEEERSLGSIEAYNKIKLSSCRFKLDAYAVCDNENSFERHGQAITRRQRRSSMEHRQYASLIPLPNVALLSFRLIRTKEHNICVGVLLPDRVKQLSTRREERAISYKLKGGELWEDGCKVVNALHKVEKVGKGEVLTLFVNSEKRVMQWWKSARLLLERSIPPAFDGKELHPFVNMIHEGDCVEFV